MQGATTELAQVEEAEEEGTTEEGGGKELNSDY